MTHDTQDGGLAFPVASGLYGQGMSLRDWFAGQVLAGIMSDKDWHDLDPTFVTKTAYLHADAMLAARGKP